MRKMALCRTFLLILVAVILMGLVACMDKVHLETQEDIEGIKNGFLQYLSEKYDQEFLPLALNTADMMMKKDEFRAYVTGSDPERDAVVAYRSKEGEKLLYEDNYFGLRIREDYEQKLEELLRVDFPTHKVFVDQYADITFDAALTGETTLEEAVTAGLCPTAYVWVFVKATPEVLSNFESKVNRGAEAVRAEGLLCNLKIYAVSEATYAETVRTNYKDTLLTLGKVDGTICLAMKSIWTKPI